MDPVVILITLIATFNDVPNVLYYSHNPQVMFVKENMCKDVLNAANEYFYEGAERYVWEQFPNRSLSTLSMECMDYSVSPEGEFVPLEYEVLGEWSDDDYNEKLKGMRI